MLLAQTIHYYGGEKGVGGFVGITLLHEPGVILSRCVVESVKIFVHSGEVTVLFNHGNDMWLIPPGGHDGTSNALLLCCQSRMLVVLDFLQYRCVC